MNKVLNIILISLFSLTIISCSSDDDVATTSTTDTTTTTGGAATVELSLSGVVTTLAGSTTSGSANGTGTAASFNYPADIATDGTSLFVSDMSNHMIRKID